MKSEQSHKPFVFELDGRAYRKAGDQLLPLGRLQEMAGDAWLITDFGESMTRFMSVEGPAKYAEVLARRKLQESGEIEEPVEIFTHWKRKRDGHTTDIFFTAVPTRLARLYTDELHGGQYHVLVFALYSVMWDLVARKSNQQPVAAVFRHDRFAEVLIGMRNRVYFANRCVAFDTEQEQIKTLWESVRSDIEMVQRDQRIDVERIYTVGWIDACETPSCQDEWLDRVVMLENLEHLVEETPVTVSLPSAAATLSARQSVSSPLEIAFYYARQWAPAANIAMAALVVVMGAVAWLYWSQGKQLGLKLDTLHHQINKVNLEMAKLPVVGPEAGERLKFVQNLALQRRQPAYREVVDDLTDPDFFMLQVSSLKLDYAPDAVRVSLFGDIVAPFEEAHGRYRAFLDRLTSRGYRIEENRFETQISKSQVVLKLIRPVP